MIQFAQSVGVGNEIFDRRIRKEFAELAAKLGSQGFVVRKHERRAPYLLNDIGHGECLAGARNPQPRLFFISPVYASHKLFDCFRLVARRLVRRY